MKRGIWCLGVVLGLALGMAAAQGDGWENVDPSGQRVVFWHVHSGANEALLQEIVQEFNAGNEYGITVVAENQGSYGDLFQKMLPLLNTRDVPDLVLAYQNQAATYQLADALVDMDPLFNSDKWGYSQAEKDDFFPGFIQADVFPTFDGARLGFPPNRSMEVMYYNSEWLQELGFDAPPSTPEEFREVTCAAAEQPFSKATGQGATGYEISIGASTLASWVFAFGGDIYDYEANQYSYDSQAAIDAMTFLQGLIDDGCAAVEVERYAAQGNFGQGLTLFATGSSVGIPYYQSAVDEGAQFAWSVGAFPHTTPDPVMNLYGPSVSMPDTGSMERQVATWLFIKHLVSPEEQAQWARASNYFPVRQSVAAELGEYFEANPQYETAFELLPYGAAEPPTPGYDFVRDLVQQEMAAILTGAPVEETLADVNEEANEILAEQLEQIQAGN